MFAAKEVEGVLRRRWSTWKESVYKNYGEATVPGTSPSSGYELMHEPDFPVLRVGSCMVVPKEKYIQWMEEHTGGAI